MKNLSLYIAKRYLFSKKKRNVINLISAISVVGVTIGTMALIVVLSAFNGLDELLKSLFNSFDPDLKITALKGKTFTPDSTQLKMIKNTQGVIEYVEVLEEKALLEYDKRQYIGKVKGVGLNFNKVTGIDTLMVEGNYVLQQNDRSYAVLGYGVAYYLSVGLKFIDPLIIYVPKREGNVSMNPQQALTRKIIYPSGFFSVQAEYDEQYIIVPIHFARDLLDYSDEVSAIEVKLDKNLSESQALEIQSMIQKNLGADFEVKNRFQQHELFYKIMKSEKWATFLILSFILFIASFNIIGSLTMLIIDKKEDISTLQSLGAGEKLIRKIFLFEGWMISFAGALLGLLFGTLLCLLQIHFELIQFPGNTTIVEAYPVRLEWSDFIYVFITVMVIGFFASWYPVKLIIRKYLRAVQ